MEGKMWIIRSWASWKNPVVMLAYEIIDGHIVFDTERGDPEFRRGIITHGVPVLDENGNHAGYVRHDDGEAFHNACLITFSTSEITIASEEHIAAMNRRMQGGSLNSDFPPAGISAA